MTRLFHLLLVLAVSACAAGQGQSNMPPNYYIHQLSLEGGGG